MADVANGAPRPNKTLYVRSLNESIKLPILKQDLQTTFSQFGHVVNVIAHKNIRMRGQAFIVFEDQAAAQTALRAVQGFPFHGKPMVVQYAKTPSDDTVKRERSEEEFEEHKRRRLQVKGTCPVILNGLCLSGYTNFRLELKKAREATNAAQHVQQPAQAVVQPRKPRPAQPHIPAQHLPPNKVLFIQNLPDSTTKEQLVAIYGQWEGFREVRMVPGRAGIAFVEYDTEGQAGLAKTRTKDLVLEDRHVSVTYQRKVN
jgi:U2 small nuclear ribonucleoprotein B''